MPSPVHPYSDYGVALRTLRSARGWLGFLLLICVIAQFIGFSLMIWTPQPYHAMRPEIIGPTTSPLDDAFAPNARQAGLNIRDQWNTAYTLLVPITQITSLLAVTSQAVILFITLLVVLVAQAPGVTQLTKALVWSVLLLFVFFPWQYFARDIPGVIYSYTELKRYILPMVVSDPHHPFTRFESFLLYFRFVGWPIIGLLVLLITSERYRAGIMIAIGHPLQSMLQPGGGRPVGPLPITSPEKRMP